MLRKHEQLIFHVFDHNENRNEVYHNLHLCESLVIDHVVHWDHLTMNHHLRHHLDQQIDLMILLDLEDDYHYGWILLESWADNECYQ